MNNNNDKKVLDVENLHVSFHTYLGEVKAVRGVSFNLKEGETLALVGESGCGKTVCSKAILRILPKNSAEIKKESTINFNGKDVLAMNKKRLKAYRGADVSMIFQDPMTSLNPTTKIGKQITESLLMHTKMNKKEANEEAIKLLELVNIPNPKERINQYPFELSGGLRQRVMIAIALACNPKILLADEPTTALDVTVQAQILDLLSELKEKKNTAIVLVTHDLGVVADFADRILIMYAGEVMEEGSVREIFKSPNHPYTEALLKSVPRLDTESKQELYSLGGTPPDLLLEIKGCPFVDRCQYAMNICRKQKPEKTALSDTHRSYCWRNHPYAKEASQGQESD